MKNSSYDSLYDDIKSGSNIISDDEFKNIIYGVSQVASDMVVKTLGPGGKTTLLDDGTFVYPTKDGYNVLNRLRFTDPIYNSLFNTLRQISFSIVNKVGDGTTTALVGANCFLKRLMELEKENSGLRQADLIKTIEDMKSRIVDELKTGKELRTINPEGNFEDIYKIALVSSNNNEPIAKMIQEIYQETKNPNIYVALDASDKLSSEIQNGYKLDSKVINFKAYINEGDGTCKKNEPNYIAIFDHNVTYNEHGQILTMLSRYAASKNREFIVLAPHFDDVITTVIGTSINTMLQKNQIPNIMMVQIPLSLEVQRQYLSDVVMLTNAQVFDYGKVRLCNIMVTNQTLPEGEKIDEPLLHVPEYQFEKPEDVIASCVGTSTKMTITDKYIIFQEYDRVVNETMLKNTIEEAKATFLTAKEKANKSTTMLNKDYMDAYQRYTKLVGKMGVIKVGGSSELEKHCVKDMVDDAVLACRSAYDNGYVTGLNVSLLRSIDKIIQLDEIIEDSLEHEILEIFYSTFEEVSLLVMKNAYNDDELDIEDIYKLVKYPYIDEPKMENCKEIIENCVDTEFNFNLITDSYETRENCTVINSVSTDIEIMNAIVGILSIMLTSNQFLSVNRSYDRKISKQQAMDIVAKEKAYIVKSVIKEILNLDEKVITSSPIYSLIKENSTSLKLFLKKLFK